MQVDSAKPRAKRHAIEPFDLDENEFLYQFVWLRTSPLLQIQLPNNLQSAVTLTARPGVHGGDQLEVGWEGQRLLGPRDGDLLRLEMASQGIISPIQMR